MYDLFADPTNIMGGVLVKGLDAVQGATKGRGLITGSSPNVIDDFYGLNPEKAFPDGTNPQEVKRMIDEGVPVPKELRKAYDAWSRGTVAAKIVNSIGKSADKLPDSIKSKIDAVVNKMPTDTVEKITKFQRSTDPEVRAQANRVLGSYFKTKGFVEWAGKSAANALSEAFDPSSRAMYRDTGISRTNQKRINEQFEKGAKDPRGLKSAVAQLQHAAYMAWRRGRKDLPPVLQETLDQMSIGGFQKMDQDLYAKTSRTVEKELRGQAYKTPAEVSKTLFRHARNNWGIPEDNNVTMVVRQPNGVSGNFVYDANRKSKPVITGRSIFKQNPQGFKSATSLKKAFIAKGYKPEDIKVVPKGVVITSSAASTSYLEGGINMVTHINTDGVANVVISDQYDFLEKVPLVKNIENSMKEDVWGVTPPITVDLLKETESVVNKRTKPEDLDILKTMTSEAKPTADTTAAEYVKTGLLSGLAARELTDEDE
jgi:hypothetical protein